MAAIYQADVWCDDCADAICKRPQLKGSVSHLSNDEESDSPQHCAAHEKCLNAVELPSGRKVGYLFGSLTSDGVDYVRQAAFEGGQVAALWVKHFSDEGYDLELTECPHCGGFVDAT